MIAPDERTAFPPFAPASAGDVIAESTMAYPQATLIVPWPNYETWGMSGRGFASKERRLSPTQEVSVTAWWAARPAPLATTFVTPQAWLNGMIATIERSLLRRAWVLQESENQPLELQDGYCRRYAFTAVSVRNEKYAPAVTFWRRSGRICDVPDRKLLVQWEYCEYRSETDIAFAGFDDEAASFLDSFTLYGAPQ